MCPQCPQPRLLPENVPIVRAYLACATQWRHGGLGLRTGLDYAGVLTALRADLPGRPKRVRRLFAGIRVIEAALLSAQAERVDAIAKEKR